MAKVHLLPAGLQKNFQNLVDKVNDWNVRDYNVRLGHEQAAKALIMAAVRDLRPDLVDATTGKEIRFPVADGQARYFVVSCKGAGHLIHLPFGDAWHAHEALIRGLRAADIRADVNRPSFASL